MRGRICLFLMMLIMATLSATAQQVRNVQSGIENQRLVVTYNVIDLIDGQRFDVDLYSSVDGFSEPISEGLAGDVGDDIRLSVSGNRIELNNPLVVLRKYGTLDDNISFKVRIKLVYSPVQLQKPVESFVAKRGGYVNLEWTGGLASDPVSVDLLRYDNVIQQGIYSEATNTYNARVKLPPGLELGDGYSVQLSLQSIDEPIEIPYFKVKRKFGWGWRIALGITTLVVLDYLILENGVTRSALGQEPDLPEPPGVPSASAQFSLFNLLSNQ